MRCGGWSSGKPICPEQWPRLETPVGNREKVKELLTADMGVGKMGDKKCTPVEEGVRRGRGSGKKNV